MTSTGLILDAVVIVIMVLSLVWGGCRGLLLTVANAVTRAVVALCCAMLSAQALCGKVGAVIAPRLEPVVSQRLTQAMSESASDSSGLLGDLLSQIPGVQSVADALQTGMVSAIAGPVTLVVAELLAWFLLVIAFYIVFKLVFLLVKLVCKGIDEIPGLHLVNHVLGAFLGLIAGVLFVALAGTVLSVFGVLPEQMLAETRVLGTLVGAAIGS